MEAYSNVSSTVRISAFQFTESAVLFQAIMTQEYTSAAETVFGIPELFEQVTYHFP
jgi:hypothetical protein